MGTDVQVLEDQLQKLSSEEQLRLARWLIDRAVGTLSAPGEELIVVPNGLLALAGRFSGGPGDSAERAEAILEAEVDSRHGLHSS